MKYKTVTLLTPNIRFSVLMLCPISFSPSSLEKGGEEGVYFCHSPWTHTQSDLNFCVKFEPC